MEKDITDKEMEPNINNISEISDLEMESEMENEKGKRGKESLNQLSIHLGDILRISSPGNLKYHEKTFLVDYCGVKNMLWIDVESGVSYELKLVGKGHEEFEEKEGIVSIELLSREKYPGYAKQNGLEVGIWVDVEFGGEVPFLVSGMISNLEEDQIEITTWPNQEIFYLDFQYEGLWNIEPKIEKIQIRDAPSLEAEKVMAELRETNRVRNGELEDLLDAELEEREGLESMLENEEAESNRLERLREEYVQGTAFAKSILPEIEYGEVLGNYYQRVEQRKEDVRYSLNAQLEDFMNELLSTLPNYMRTPQVMEEVEHTLERFRELHVMFARMNDSGAVTGYRSNRYLGKPLVSSLVDFSVGGGGDSGAVAGKWIRNTGWVIPVVYMRKKGWHDVIADEGVPINMLNNDENGYFNAREREGIFDDGKGGEEWVQNPACVWLKGMQEAMDKWVSDSGRGGYRKLLQELDIAMSPVMQFSKEQILAAGMRGREENGGGEEEGWNIVGPYEAGVPLEMVVDNTAFRNEGVFGNAENGGFYSTVARVANGEKIERDDVILERRRFVVQKQVDAVSLLTMHWSNSGKKTLEREVVVPNEKLALKSVILMPEAWMAFSRVGLPGTDILTRTRLGSWWPQISRVLNKSCVVDNVVVDDLTRDYAYSKTANEMRCASGRGQGRGRRQGGAPEDGDEFLDGVREYVLAMENVKSSGSRGNPLEKLLNTVIPNNLYLIDFMCSYLKGSQYSLTHYAQIMEPLGIYSWNMRYTESYVMQKKIRDKIAEYRVLMENGRRDYLGLAQFYKKNEWGVKYRNSERFFHWLRNRGDEFMGTFLDWYHMNIGALTTSEILVRIYALDDGALWCSVMSYLHYALITLNRFTGVKGGGGWGFGGNGGGDEWLGDWDSEGGGIRAIRGSGKLKLAKRYASLTELHDDDHCTDLVWDKALDISPYHLAEQYGGETGGAVGDKMEEMGAAVALSLNMAEGDGGGDVTVEGGSGEMGGGGSGNIRQTMRQKLSASEFLEYLAMNLKDRHYCPAEQAVELASILMNGKRPVKGGEYASVQMGGGDVGYYQRKHHTWVRDNSLDFGKEMDEKHVFSNLEKVGGGLGVLYGGGGAEGAGGGRKKRGGEFEDREIATLSGDLDESIRIAKWEAVKAGKKSGGAGDAGGAREREMAKERFQQKVQQSMKELEANFEKKMGEQIARIVRIYSLKQTEIKRANSFAYYLGKYKKETEARISPHSSLLELILEETDFALKQQYIVRFYHAFCREPILGGAGGVDGVDEKGYWKYCSETNVPLLPTCYYDLAMEYVNGGDYGQLLELLCSQIGNESSDGDAIIDRFTGRILKKKNLDIEEGFDEMGFQRKTRDVLGDAEESGGGGDLGESSAAEGSRVREEERGEIGGEEEEDGGEYLKEIDEALAVGNTAIGAVKNRGSVATKTAKEYGEGDNERIASVAFYLLQEMGILNSVESQEWIDALMNFVIQRVSELLTNKEFIETEKRFEQKRKLALEKGKAFPFSEYSVYKNQKLLYSTVGALLIGIQTVAGDIKLSRNATSCIRSLKGYPTGMGGSGKDDKMALRYMACLLIQQQSDEAPWNARIKGKKEETQMNVVSDYIDKYLLGNRAVEDRIGVRRAYEAEHGEVMEDAVPLVLRMERQQNLLPPMEKNLKVEDRQIMSVSREFLEEWKEEMRKKLSLGGIGGKGKGSSEGIVRMKLMALGYSLFENVNAEVSHQIRGFLMKTMLGEPFLENACCQSEGAGAGQVPLRYFVEKNAVIGKVLKTSRLLERALEIAEGSKKSVLLYHAESTRIGNGDFWDRGNGSSYFKANIYAALIHYFHYDRPLLPVPEYLRGKVFEEAPKGYPMGGVLKEKIEFLERAGRHYDVEKLQHCMMLVGQQNILSRGEELIPVVGEGEEGIVGDALGDFLTSSMFEFSSGRRQNMEEYENLLQKLTDVYREWKRGTMQNNASPRIRALNAFLAKSNAAMFERISKEWKPVGGAKERGLLVFLEQIQSWKLAGDIDRESVNRANSDSLQQIVRFIRNMTNMFAFTYAKRIDAMQEFNGAGKKALPKHWGFADEHYTILADYIRKTFGGLIRTRGSEGEVDELFQFFERLSLEEDGLFRQIRQLLEFFPVFTPLSLVVGENGEREVFYSLFPKESCYGVHVFCLYFILTRYLEVSSVYGRSVGLNLRRIAKSGPGVGAVGDIYVSMQSSAMQGEEMAVIREDMEDRQIMEGRQLSWKEKIRQFFYDCLEVERDNKEVADNTYDQLRRKQDETEKREKKRITDGLKNMEIYQRRVENQMKDLKLGNWNVGQQKGLFQYDKETFNREMLEQQYGIVLDAGEGAGGGEGGRGILYDTERGELGDDYLNGEEADRMRDMELNGDIMGLGEDWDDGGEFE
jgi:hypothetical protein